MHKTFIGKPITPFSQWTKRVVSTGSLAILVETCTCTLISVLGSLRNHDGYGDENVTSNYASTLFMLYNMGKVCCNQTGMCGFEAKREKERFAVVCPRCRQHLKILRCCFDEDWREMYKNAYRTCSTVILVLLTNNITAFWHCRCRCRRRFLNSL